MFFVTQRQLHEVLGKLRQDILEEIKGKRGPAGPQGEAGEAGERGEAGPRGEPGASAKPKR